MSFFKELKRRNVFKVAAAYLIVAWLLIQMGDTLAPALHLPEWVNSALVFFIILGFPLALIFAWAFELTPEGLKKDREADYSRSIASDRRFSYAVMALLALAVIYFVFDKLVMTPRQGAEFAPVTQPAATETAVAPDPVKRSIAILPFTNMSPDPENEYFADGISEELLNVLADIEELRVPSRTSSFAFKGQNLGIRDIAKQLEVDHILEGSVRKAGDRVRITAQLIDINTDTHLWSETYDRELENIFAIQEEIAGHIIEALKVSLALDFKQAPTSDMEAYTLYLQGRELFRRRSGAELLMEADRILRKAVDRDPQLAGAWATLAMVNVTLPGYTKLAWTDYHEPAIEFAERALALDPDQAEAKLALSNVLFIEGKHHEALETLMTVTEQHPRHSQARLWLAIALYKAGYLAEAFEQAAIAVKLDPVHGTMLDWYARSALAVGRPELVVDLAERAIQLGREQGRVPLMEYFIDEGNFADMEPYVRNAEQNWGGFRWAFKVRDNPGLLPDAMTWSDQYAREGGNPAYFVLFFLVVADSPEKFFAQLNMIHTVDDSIDAFVWIPAVKRHRQSDAMKSWARSRGYEALWRVRGWPDLCRPVNDDDWKCD